MKKYNKIIFILFLVAVSCYLIANILPFFCYDLEIEEELICFCFYTLFPFFLTVLLLVTLGFYPKLIPHFSFKLCFSIYTILYSIYIIAFAVNFVHTHYISNYVFSLQKLCVVLGIITAVLSIGNVITEFIAIPSQKKKLKKAAPVILTKLKELYDKKIITEEEYAEKRKKYADML